jgi:hypothetical protein
MQEGLKKETWEKPELIKLDLSVNTEAGGSDRAEAIGTSAAS